MQDGFRYVPDMAASPQQPTTYHPEDIRDLLRPFIGAVRLERHYRDDIQLHRDLGLTGDDFDQLMEQYQTRFGVDLSNFRWYFHYSEEGFSPASWFIRPPNRRVQHIPITPALLLASANAGKWLVDYPPHNLPRRRWDTIANLALLLALLGVFALAGWARLSR